MNAPFDSTTLFLAVPFVLFALFLMAQAGTRRHVLSYPYHASSALLSPHETSFLQVLEQAAGPYRIFAKVRLADVITVQRRLPRGQWQNAFNRISHKHLDFVLCDPHDLSVFCVVELDDKSHERPDRQVRDAFLEQALRAAQVPLVRVPSHTFYDSLELRDLLSSVGVGFAKAA